MVTSTCPQPDDLRSFHLGMLDERRELEVLDHLNACQACEDTVANLEGTDDSLVAAVRNSAGSESSAHEDRPALQQALAEIEGFIKSPVPSDAKQKDAASPVSERIRDYELLGTLGEGGMGTVYRARHTRLDRQVALKLLPARRLRDNAAVARFEREMKAIGRLDHPTIVRATDAGDVDGTHFLAMDYVEGIDLSKLVRLVGPLDVASACEIVRQAAIGLDYAHQQDLIHRDVKPSNLMLTLRGEVRILDLGLALFGAASEALDELTTVGQLMGTLDYMAPEQGDNSHDVDARADVYSLGATLFKLLTATAPYDSPGCRTPLAKMKALATIDAPSVAERRPELPSDLVTIIDRCLSRNADDRFASANELAESLLPFCEDHLLADLAECGRDLATQEEAKVVLPPSLPPFVRRSDVSDAGETPETQVRRTNNRPGLGRKVARWMLLPLVMLAGIVIWIQTDNGQLVIESAEADLPIEIRRGGEFYTNETLVVGKNELTIRSGTYEIVLPAKYDSLKVENESFTLERGGEWIARVSKKKAAQAGGQPAGIAPSALSGVVSASPGGIPDRSVAAPGMPPGAGIPDTSGLPSGQRGSSPLGTTLGAPRAANNRGTLVFSGKNFEEWQRAVLTERNPVELRKAVEALCVLGRNNRDVEAAETVLRVIDAYPCDLMAGSDESSLVASAIRHIRTLDAKSVVPAIAESIRSRAFNARKLILDFLITGKELRAVTFSSIGKGEPLASRLKESVEVRDSLLAVFAELESEQQEIAFGVLYYALNSQPSDQKLIQFLESCIQNKSLDHVSLGAAGRLAEIRPSAELAELFVDHLEGTHEALKTQNRELEAAKWGGGSHKPQLNWWGREAIAWKGLAAVAKQAAGSADRIANLVNSVPDEMAMPQTIYLMASPSRAKTRFEIHRQLLPIEILAMIGPSAQSTVPAINNVLKTLTGAAPNPEADYGFDGFHKELVLERIVGQDARTGVPSPEALPADVEQIRDRPQRLDSALVAIRRITGQPARFGVSHIDAHGPRDSGAGMEGGYPGGASAGMMSGYSGEGGYGEDVFKQYSPRLVTYKGKSFAEWAAPPNAAPNMPLNDLRDIFRGTSLLAGNPAEARSAAEIANGAFGYAIRQPWPLTPELQTFLVATIEASYSHDPNGILTPIEDALAQVTPARQAFLLSELLLPVEESDFGFRLHERPFSRKGVANSQFPNAYNELVENWDKHSAELREAILQVEAHLPAFGQKNSVQLLTRLVKEAYGDVTSDAKAAGAMTDLQLKAAFILTTTKPTNAEVRQQLETLLSEVLAKPHVLRLNPRLQGAESEFHNAPTPVEVKPPTMRDLDADRLHAAIALKLSCGGSLSEATARQFAELIIQDTERHEVGAFQIVSPPNWPPVAPLAVGLKGYSGGEGNASEFEMGSGYPGMGGEGYPGAMAAGGGGMPGGGYSDYGMTAEPMIGFKGRSFSADHGEFSRRVLLIQLLLTSPPDDSKVRNEIGELLAASLLKRYPHGFLPAPQDEDNNVNVYDLIEAEFQSGVRFRKRPTTKKGILETARFIDAASSVVWNYLPDDRRMQIHQTKVAELQAAQTSGVNPQKQYDGKPFESWLQVVSTERSPERLAEAVTALAILGKDGRDTEAASAILKCLAPFSASSRGQKTPEGQLVDTIDHRFWQLDRPESAPVVADIIENGNSSQRTFLLIHNSRHIKDWLKPNGLLATPQFVKALLEATQDRDSEVRWQATAFLIPMLLTEQVPLKPETLTQATERLKTLLTEPRAKTPAAICLAKLAPETPGLADVLLAEVEQLVATSDNGPIYTKVSRDNHDSLQFFDAYWALRKLIVHNQTTPEELMTRLLELLQVRREGEPGRIFEVDYYRFDHRTLVAELLVAGTPRTQVNKSTIHEALTKLANSAAQLPNRQAKNGELAENTAQPDLPTYTPVLTDIYPFPLPSALRYPQSSAWEEKLSHQRVDEFRAAKWALEQLEKSSPLENADE